MALDVAPEREAYAEVLEHEVKQALRMLRRFPGEGFDRRGPDCGASALELAMGLAARARRIEELASVRRPEPAPVAARTRQGAIQDLETACMGSLLALDAMPPFRWEEVVATPCGLAPWRQARRGELLWLALRELARHRQHFALHLRSARHGVGDPTRSASEPGPRLPLAAGA